MHIKKPETSIERQIATGLIISDEFITEFRPICKFELFQSKFARTVSEWCIKYFDTYQESPKRSIEGIFESKKEYLDDTVIELINEFLISISEEFGRDKFNYKFVLDEAETYLKKMNLKALSTAVDGLCSNGDISEAEAEVANFYNLSRPESKGIDLFNDIDQIKKILTRSDKDELFNFKGVLGKLIDVCCRGEFLAFFAPEKRGKSWWLQETALTAITKGCNVAFFSLEMDEEKMLTRFLQYFTGRPSKKKHLGCKIPYLVNKNIKYRVSNKPLLTPNYAAKKLTDLKQLVRGATLKLVCWPSDSKTMNDVNFQLDVWKRYEDFIPDVVIIDYADLLAPVDKKLEYRIQLDGIWKSMKRMAQERHCLMVSASQTQVETQKKKIHKGSASEAKSKTAHPDRIIALNQTAEDQEKMVMRVAVLFDRHDSDQGGREVLVLQQLAIGKPYLGSYHEPRSKA